MTGAARGIGAATVHALAASGRPVLAVDACTDDPALPYPLGDRGGLDATVQRAAAAAPAPDLVAGWVADVRDRAALASAMGEAERRWGSVEVAVAAAGVIAGGRPLWEQPADEVAAVLDVDLGGVVALAVTAVPAMLRGPEPRAGRFVAVASVAGSRGLPMLAAYCAAKAGVLGLVRALALELAGSGVTVNAVSPGSTRTDLLRESARLYGLPGADAFAAQQPVGRLVEPAEVAAAVLWLCAPDRGGVTGADLPVDGGLSL